MFTNFLITQGFRGKQISTETTSLENKIAYQVYPVDYDSEKS